MHRTRSRRFLTALCGALVLVVTVQVTAEDTERPLRIILAGSIAQLDPHLDPTAVGSSIFGNIFEGLLKKDESGKEVPALAVSWNRTDDKIWRFELRQGVHFHTGAPLTSADVIASVNRTRGNSGVLTNSIAEAVAEGPHTVRIELIGPDAGFLSKISSLLIVPFDSPQTITNPIGTGPYRVVSSVLGESISLSAFSDYWGATPHMERVEIYFQENPDTALERLSSGEVDVVSSISAQSVEAIEANDDLWVSSAIGSTVLMLGLNSQQQPFDDPLVREAVDVGLDRDQLSQEVFLKLARPANQIISDSVYGFHPTLELVEQNKERARALLSVAAAGSSVPFTLEFVPESNELAKAMKSQLTEVGFRVELQARTWSELLPRIIEGKIQAAVFSWRSNSRDVGFSFAQLIHSQSSSNLQLGISTAEIDRLVIACRTVMEPDLRLELLHGIAERLSARRVLLPLVFKMDLYGIRRNVEWEASANGVIELSTMNRPSTSPPQ